MKLITVESFILKKSTGPLSLSLFYQEAVAVALILRKPIDLPDWGHVIQY